MSRACKLDQNNIVIDLIFAEGENIPTGYEPCDNNAAVGYIKNQDGTFDPAPLQNAGPDLSKRAALINLRVDQHINETAQGFRFGSIVSAVTYRDEPTDSRNQPLAAALSVWRSQCYSVVRQIEADFFGDLIPEPTAEEVIAQLPNFVPPE